MKKLQKSYYNRTISKVKIFLDDLEFLIDKIEKSKFTYKLKDSDFEYESLNEIKLQQGNNPNEIEFDIRNPEGNIGFLTLRIREGSVYIHANFDQKLIGFANELETFFKERRTNWIYSFLNNKAAIFNIVFNLIVFAVFAGYHYYKSLEFELSIWPYILLFWIMILIISLILPKGNLNIELEKEHQKNYFKNNKEKIAMNALMLILGAILTIIIQRLF